MNTADLVEKIADATAPVGRWWRDDTAGELVLPDMPDGVMFLRLMWPGYYEGRK